jgi:hypothetical protein
MTMHAFVASLAAIGAGARRLLPALRAFDPDIVLLSAGFDGTKGTWHMQRPTYAHLSDTQSHAHRTSKSCLSGSCYLCVLWAVAGSSVSHLRRPWECPTGEAKSAFGCATASAPLVSAPTITITRLHWNASVPRNTYCTLKRSPVLLTGSSLFRVASSDRACLHVVCCTWRTPCRAARAVDRRRGMVCRRARSLPRRLLLADQAGTG